MKKHIVFLSADLLLKIEGNVIGNFSSFPSSTPLPKHVSLSLFHFQTLISVISFSKQMQMCLMICITRSFLGLICFGILVKDSNSIWRPSLAPKDSPNRICNISEGKNGKEITQ